MKTPELTWHINTAIDFFDSAAIIFNPESYQLRPAWAAGVRSRLSAAARETLQAVFPIHWVPVTWFHQMDEPASAEQALEILANTPAEERVMNLYDFPHDPPEIWEIIHQIIARGTWHEQEYQTLRKLSVKDGVGKKNIKMWLNLLAATRRLGPRILPAMQEFFEIFYAEEEKRVRPYLIKAAEEGKKLSAEVDLITLLETLSEGINYQLPHEYKKIIFAPSFWTTPLIADIEVDRETLFFIYGVRPANVPLIPGDQVPNVMHQALKTLADPTRLKILKLLRHQPHSPGELAKALRLRPPTVTHHLRILRQARLIRITLSEEDRRIYEFRPDGLRGVLISLEEFLEL